MREANQFNKILQIIGCYKHDKSLHQFLSEYYRKNRQMGSKDRKLTSCFIYNYFRFGKALQPKSVEERIAVANFLCSKQTNDLLTYCILQHSPLHISDIENSIQEKINLVTQSYPNFLLDALFPFASFLSDEIEKDKFLLSFLEQPKLWIRVREQFRKKVEEELTEKCLTPNPSPKEMGTAMSFDNGISLDKLDSYQKGYFEIQDLSSQKTGTFFRANEHEHWWDCCAGSGGKSLMLAEQTPSVKLFVSDIRSTILNNLKERFKKVKFENYALQQLDLLSDFTNLQSLIPNPHFDGIIVDAPCSGSGTWARTPESISQFDSNALRHFSSIQKKIIQNVMPFLNSNAPLIYITCSVFKEENEEVIHYCKNNLHLLVEDSAIIKGYEQGADSMFVARLKKREVK